MRVRAAAEQRRTQKIVYCKLKIVYCGLAILDCRLRGNDIGAKGGRCEMKRLIIVFCAAAAWVAGCAADRESGAEKDIGGGVFQPKPLEDEWSMWLVGEWEAAGESEAGEGKGRIVIEKALNGQFLFIHGEAEITELSAEQVKYLKETLHASDEDIERFAGSTFEELQVRTVDVRTGEVVYYLFDSMRCVAEGKGQIEGDKEVTHWEWKGAAQRASSVRIMERVGRDRLIVTERYKLPNGKAMEDKGEMRRKAVRARG